MELRLYRNQNPTITIPIDERTIYTDEVMERHFIQCSFISASVLDIKVDDYIIFRNDRYNINVDFQYQKRSNFEYKYTILFEHVSYWLKERIFMHLGDIEFSFYGSPSDYVQLIVDCMNEEDSNWAVGNVDILEHKLISFYGEEKGYTCKGALMKIAEEFGLEFWFTGKTIHLTKEAGVQTNLDFEYGRGKGLYSLTRGAHDTPLHNRIYGFGSTKNIPYGYRNGAKRLTFEGRKLERPLAPGERRRETSVIFDDIFPKRTGTLTAISADWLNLTDTSIDFYLNGQKIDGETPKIVFQTGELGGKEFEITGYNHATKTISIEPLVESDGYTTPNATFSPKIGDKYVFVGIEMPQTYVDAAEAQVKSETQKVFNQLTRPPYQVEIDEKYLRDNGVLLNAGDRVRLRDTEMGIDDMIRVTAVSFPLVNENQVTAVISDKILYTNEVKQVIETDKIKETVKVVDRTKAELARRNMLQTRRLQELTFDPDGYFDGKKIKPLSIETYMLSVGAKSQNFGLNGVSINANTEGDPNHLSISHGSLVHYEIEIEGLGYVWQMNSTEFPMLDPDKAYYLSARVRTTALSGTWYLSETPMDTESETGYWHFNLGILYPVADGSRGFDFTKGMTFIVGDRITTGRIQSLDLLNYFDLNTGQFKLGTETKGIDWNVTTPDTLTIKGFSISDVVQVGSGGFVSAGLSGLNDVPLDGLGNPLYSAPVRIWAGADQLNKYAAVFKVLADGSMFATKGRIGFLDVDASMLKLGDVQNPVNPGDPWEPGQNVVQMQGHSFLYRQNGIERGKIKELAFSVYPDSATDPFTNEAVRVTNNIQNPTFNPIPGDNKGLVIDVSGANEQGRNIALDIKAGATRFNGAEYHEQIKVINAGVNYTCNKTDRYIGTWQVGQTITLPPYPSKGRIIEIMTLGSGTNTVTSGGYGYIYAKSYPGSGTTSITLQFGAKFMFDGDNWYFI